MAFSVVGSSGEVVDTAAIEVPATTATAFVVGDLLSIATVSGSRVVQRAVSGDTVGGDSHFYAIAASTKAAATATARVVPLTNGMRLRVNCTNDTAAGQRLVRRPVTDETTLNNRATDSTAATAPFLIENVVGAVGDRIAIVRVVGVLGQVAS